MKTKIQHTRKAWAVAKAVLRGKFIAMSAYILKNHEISNK
jgi:hypothetical protein